MVRDDRILDWELGEMVDRLMDSGIKKPKAVADKMNQDPDVQAIIKGARVLPHDVSCYVKSKKAWSNDKVVAAARSEEGQAVLDAVKSEFEMMTQDLDKVRRVTDDIFGGTSKLVKKWREKVDEWDGEGEAPSLPQVAIDSYTKLRDLAQRTAQTLEKSERIQAFMRVQEVNYNQGHTNEDLYKVVRGTVEKLACPECGYRNFTMREGGAAFAEAMGSSGAIDAQVVDG